MDKQEPGGNVKALSAPAVDKEGTEEQWAQLPSGCLGDRQRQCLPGLRWRRLWSRLESRRRWRDAGWEPSEEDTEFSHREVLWPGASRWTC